VTVVSAAFAPLAQVTGEGIGHMSLPFVVVPHPVGDRDVALVQRRGEEIAERCVHAVTTPVELLMSEIRENPYPLPEAVMPR
jgi:hypothetical protein